MTYPLGNTPESTWFKTFEAALKGLPAEDRREIIREVRDHLYERVREGKEVDDVLSAFGPAPEYAKGFLDEYALTRARESGKTLAMFSTVVHFARRSLAASVGLSLAFLFSLVIIGSLVCLTIKIARPDLVGLWVDLPLSAHHRYEHSGPERLPLRLGDDHIQFGYANPAPQFPEVVGAWMYPSLLGLALLGYLGLRWTLFRTLKGLLGKRI